MNIGAQLRQARESRGLTVATLAATTRIHGRVLEAIERNDLSAIPPHPYARGFVAAFAREVGLNPDAIVREYFAQFDPAPEAIDTTPAAAAPAIPPEWRAWLPALGGLLLVIALGALVSRRAEAPRTSEPPLIGTSGAATASGDPTDAAAVARDPRGVAPARNDAAPPSELRAAPGILVVILETQAPSWVAAMVDGRRQVYQIVPAGTKMTLRGAQEIALRVGNAGGVRWSINGREAVLMGRPGEVRDVRITPEDSRSGREQPVVNVQRRTATGEAPRRQGATTENTGSI